MCGFRIRLNVFQKRGFGCGISAVSTLFGFRFFFHIHVFLFLAQIYHLALIRLWRPSQTNTWSKTDRRCQSEHTGRQLSSRRMLQIKL